jgi:hypothetical protein
MRSTQLLMGQSTDFLTLTHTHTLVCGLVVQNKTISSLKQQKIKIDG